METFHSPIVPPRWRSEELYSMFVAKFSDLKFDLKFAFKLWFSDVFRGYRKSPMAWNGLRALRPGDLKSLVSSECQKG